jgi:acetylornithine deacetylase
MLTLSYDEETGCWGAPRLIADLLRHEPMPAVAIIGEPTSMHVGTSHRGYLEFRTRFTGRAVHSSDPSRGVNAITAAAGFVARIEAWGAHEADGAEATTMRVNRIRGGTAMNIVPNLCEVGWEIRPGADADLGELRRFAGQTAAEVAGDSDTDVVVTIPPLRPDESAAELARSWGGLALAFSIPFGTEAGYYQQAGIPSVVCGPGSITEAHQPDEWITLDQISSATTFLGEAAR